jgi:hypothetical protein
MRIFGVHISWCAREGTVGLPENACGMVLNCSRWVRITKLPLILGGVFLAFLLVPILIHYDVDSSSSIFMIFMHTNIAVVIFHSGFVHFFRGEYLSRMNQLSIEIFTKIHRRCSPD